MLVSAPCLPGITTTCVSEELSMDDDKFSCIKQVHKSVHISVPSAFISNEVSGITEILDSWKRQYVKQLQGVVVGYRNVSLASRANVFVVDQPAEHCYVTAVFYLFCPNIGTIVKGTINRISRDHIGCLIHDTINVTIHLSDESYEDISRFMYLNSTILFQITHYDFARKIIRVEGEITPECIRLMETMYPESVQNSNKSSLKYLDNQQELGTSNNHNFQSKKNKKSKRMKLDAFDVLPEITSSDNHFVNFSSVKNSEIPSSKSKKVEQSVSSLNASTFSGTVDSNTDQLFPSADDFMRFLKKEIGSDEVNSESSSQKGKRANSLSTKRNVSSDNSTSKSEHPKKKLKRAKKEKLSEANSESSAKTLSSSKKRKKVTNSLSDLLNDIQPESEQPPKKKLKLSDKNKKKKDKKDSKKDKKKSCKDKLEKEKKKLSESKAKKPKHKKEKKKDRKKSDEKSKKKKKGSKHETSNILLKTDNKSEVS
ncbi:DNA-directed RNA polymerase I subunit RPA43-like [Stegodyphus dumicola]|uniref:DNA-directed RNA polymerase I subunit RPA43-like n=1 Tax=Stegodyphus dumicola TaxID=202533 RepID=UPI0015AF5CE5|nr:DNA-directed RNA polymerase I subunit RPA43-like [Stegodyphus dumicola]